MTRGVSLRELVKLMIEDYSNNPDMIIVHQLQEEGTIKWFKSTENADVEAKLIEYGNELYPGFEALYRNESFIIVNPPPQQQYYYGDGNPPHNREQFETSYIVSRVQNAPGTAHWVWQQGWPGWRKVQEGPEIASLPRPPTSKYHFNMGGQQVGEKDLNEIVQSMLNSPPGTTFHVWKQGFSGWTDANQVPEIASKVAEEHAKMGPLGGGPLHLVEVMAAPLHFEEKNVDFHHSIASTRLQLIEDISRFQ